MIKATTSKTTSFIYHMLSVGKCGYDNEYGNNARKFHKSDDIATLEKLKSYITVNGGEHCGALYSICVSNPASFDDEADMIEYFNAIIDLLTNGNIVDNFTCYLTIYQKSFGTRGITIDKQSLEDFYNLCLPLKDSILEILHIYLSNYDLYIEQFWDDEYSLLSVICDKLNSIFKENNYMELWEKELNKKYKHDDFYVVLCNSIQNGPQAIDISFNKDVFFTPTDYLEFSKFASHEFGIFLLKDVLLETNAFKDISYYKQTESLAEFYNKKICGGYKEFNWYDSIMEKYAEIYQSNPNISVKDLFLSVAI